MPFPFKGLEVDPSDRPQTADFPFDLETALKSVVTLEAHVPADAFTAETLGTERIGAAVVIDETGVLATIGYLVTEADDVVLTLHDGRKVHAHVLGVDPVSGLGLLHSLEPLGLPALPLGDSRALKNEDKLVVAGSGGRTHALEAALVTRQPFSGYWEYMLDDALFTAPAHPHWSGAALVGPDGALIGLGSLRVEQQMGGSGEGAALNMSVPVEELRRVHDDLLHGRPAAPPRPWLGLFAQEIEEHVVVIGVSPGGPAAKAELKRGDLILALDGRSVSSLSEFYRALWSLDGPGARTTLTLGREGDVFDVTVRAGDRTAMLKKPRLN